MLGLLKAQGKREAKRVLGSDAEAFQPYAIAATHPARLFEVCSSLQRAIDGLPSPYLWLVGNGRMVVIVVIIAPHSSIPY